MSRASLVVSLESGDQVASASGGIITAAKGGGIIFFGKLFAYASRMVFGIVVARAIGVAGFGLYNLSISVVLLLVGIALVGLPAGLVRFLPIALQKRDEALVWGLLRTSLALVGIISISMALFVFGFADLLAVAIFHEPTLAPLLRIISVSIPLTALGRILMAATRGFKQMQYQVYADSLIFNLVKIGLTILLLSVGSGVAGVVLAHVGAWIVEILLLIYFLNRLFSLTRLPSKAWCNTRELLSFSLPVHLSSFLGSVETNVETMLLGILGSVAWVGVYSAAMRVQLVSVMFLSALQMAAGPIISDLYSRDQNAQLGQLYQTLTKWSLAFTLPFFLMVVLFAGPILSIFGSEFGTETAALALIILALGSLVNGATGTCGTMITMAGYSKLNLINSIVSAFLMLSIDLLLIPRWGILGAATATGLVVAIMNVVRTIQVYKLHKHWPYTHRSIKPVIAGIGAFVATFLLHQFAPGTGLTYLILKVSFLYLCYIAAIILLGISEEDQLILSRVQKRFGARLGRRMPSNL